MGLGLGKPHLKPHLDVLGSLFGYHFASVYPMCIYIYINTSTVFELALS